MQNSQENTGARVSCEFCEVFKIVFFTKHLWATASIYSLKLLDLFLLQRTRVVACIDEVSYLRVYCEIYIIHFFLLAITLGTLLSPSFYHKLYWAMEICDALCGLVPFVQFKKREKQPLRSVNFSKVLASACNFTKINTPPWVFFMFLKLYRSYQIAQRPTYIVSPWLSTY